MNCKILTKRLQKAGLNNVEIFFFTAAKWYFTQMSLNWQFTSVNDLTWKSEVVEELGIGAICSPKMN